MTFSHKDLQSNTARAVVLNCDVYLWGRASQDSRGATEIRSSISTKALTMMFPIDITEMGFAGSVPVRGTSQGVCGVGRGTGLAYGREVKVWHVHHAQNVVHSELVLGVGQLHRGHQVAHGGHDGLKMTEQSGQGNSAV